MWDFEAHMAVTIALSESRVMTEVLLQTAAPVVVPADTYPTVSWALFRSLKRKIYCQSGQVSRH